MNIVKVILEIFTLQGSRPGLVLVIKRGERPRMGGSNVCLAKSCFLVGIHALIKIKLKIKWSPVTEIIQKLYQNETYSFSVHVSVIDMVRVKQILRSPTCVQKMECDVNMKRVGGAWKFFDFLSESKSDPHVFTQKVSFFFS